MDDRYTNRGRERMTDGSRAGGGAESGFVSLELVLLSCMPAGVGKHFSCLQISWIKSNSFLLRAWVSAWWISRLEEAVRIRGIVSHMVAGSALDSDTPVLSPVTQRLSLSPSLFFLWFGEVHASFQLP